MRAGIFWVFESVFGLFLAGMPDFTGVSAFYLKGVLRLDNTNTTGNPQAVSEKPQVEILRGENGQFLPGKSPNPGGRPKMTEEEKDALEEIRKLAPGVAEKMAEMLNAPRVPAIAKVRIIEIILERTYGKPETAIKLNADIQSNEQARARLEAIAARIRLEVDTGNGR